MSSVKRGSRPSSKPAVSTGKRGRRDILREMYKSLYSAFGPQGWWPVAGRYQGGPKDSNAAFEVMVGAILAQNTAWANVEKTLENLRSADCMTPEALHRLPVKKLSRLLRPSGYFNIKARRLKSFIHFLYDQFGGEIHRMLNQEPDQLRKKLLGVKGIGPETADSILLYAAGFPWFVADAYTHRVLSRHGLVAERASYRDIQALFMRDLPKDTPLYNEYHALIVKLGKEVCRKKPLCERCPLLEVLGEPVFMA